MPNDKEIQIYSRARAPRVPGLMPEESCQRVPRRVAIVHYHLQPGGVTTVIEHAVEALRAAREVEVVVLSGREYAGGKLARVEVVPQLDYGADGCESSPDGLADALEEAARRGLGGHPPDVWHCHNHSLGKNAHFPDALRQLLQRGGRFLLQIHDFAEDGRPGNFALLSQAEEPYPQHPWVHFATINSRDREFLVRAGVPESRVHELPNSVSGQMATVSAGKSERPLLIYPTRGIRRKNIGEGVLLAALCRERAFIATTRGPDNPQWRAVHDEWRSFAEERQLPIAFEVVDHRSPAELGLSDGPSSSFECWMSTACCVITTSVAEGFGLAYLESLLQGLPLLGRDLPEITADFKDRGFQFPGLYRAIRIPLAWVGEDRLLEALGEGLRKQYEVYGRALPQDGPERALAAMRDGRGRVDFGALPEHFQRDVIDHVVGNEGVTPEIIFETEVAFADADLWLDSWFEHGLSVPRLGQQRDLLNEHFSGEAYAGRLWSCYEKLMCEKENTSNDAVSRADLGSELLHTFLSPERFHFLRT